jgi:hypothetical protein
MKKAKDIKIAARQPGGSTRNTNKSRAEERVMATQQNHNKNAKPDHRRSKNKVRQLPLGSLMLEPLVLRFAGSGSQIPSKHKTEDRGCQDEEPPR